MALNEIDSFLLVQFEPLAWIRCLRRIVTIHGGFICDSQRPALYFLIAPSISALRASSAASLFLSSVMSLLTLRNSV